MPHADLVSTIPYVSSIDQILRAKKRWGVAAVAQAYRLNKLGLMTEWQYIQVNRRYRTSEPDGLHPERSSIWHMVLQELWKEWLSRGALAAKLLMPEAEIESLLFGLDGYTASPERWKQEIGSLHV